MISKHSHRCFTDPRVMFSSLIMSISSKVKIKTCFHVVSALTMDVRCTRITLPAIQCVSYALVFTQISRFQGIVSACARHTEFESFWGFNCGTMRPRAHTDENDCVCAMAVCKHSMNICIVNVTPCELGIVCLAAHTSKKACAHNSLCVGEV